MADNNSKDTENKQKSPEDQNFVKRVKNRRTPHMKGNNINRMVVKALVVLEVLEEVGLKDTERFNALKQELKNIEPNVFDKNYHLVLTKEDHFEEGEDIYKRTEELIRKTTSAIGTNLGIDIMVGCRVAKMYGYGDKEKD
jgi:hypothetical protein